MIAQYLNITNSTPLRKIVIKIVSDILNLVYAEMFCVIIFKYILFFLIN